MDDDTQQRKAWLHEARADHANAVAARREAYMVSTRTMDYLLTVAKDALAGGAICMTCGNVGHPDAAHTCRVAAQPDAGGENPWRKQRDLLAARVDEAWREIGDPLSGDETLAEAIRRIRAEECPHGFELRSSCVDCTPQGEYHAQRARENRPAEEPEPCQECDRRRNLLEDVVNALDLSMAAVDEHGPLGTAPAELVRLVLAEKGRTIRNLRAGLREIDAEEPDEWPEVEKWFGESGECDCGASRRVSHRTHLMMAHNEIDRLRPAEEPDAGGEPINDAVRAKNKEIARLRAKSASQTQEWDDLNARYLKALAERDAADAALAACRAEAGGQIESLRAEVESLERNNAVIDKGRCEVMAQNDEFAAEVERLTRERDAAIRRNENTMKEWSASAKTLVARAETAEHSARAAAFAEAAGMVVGMDRAPIEDDAARLDEAGVWAADELWIAAKVAVAAAIRARGER